MDCKHMWEPTCNEALKLALEALDSLLYWDNGKPEYDEARETITAIKQALAAPVQLTDEQIDVLRESKSKGRGAGWSFDFKGFARAIEAAHGITKGQP